MYIKKKKGSGHPFVEVLSEPPSRNLFRRRRIAASFMIPGLFIIPYILI